MTVEWDGYGWVSTCDVCYRVSLPGALDDDRDKERLEAHGWRWNRSRDPLDTCPDCLKKES